MVDAPVPGLGVEVDVGCRADGMFFVVLVLVLDGAEDDIEGSTQCLSGRCGEAAGTG